MALKLSKHDIAFFPVPKCACTSLKLFMFEIENGFPFRSFTFNGKRVEIHTLARSLAFQASVRADLTKSARFAVIRPPLSRISSCYSNKVASGQWLKRGLKKRPDGTPVDLGDLNRNPTFSEFVERLSEYRRVSHLVMSHSRPLSYFLGNDPDYYDRLFGLNQMEELRSYVSERIGASVPELTNPNRTSTPVSREEISDRDRLRVEDMFSEDIEIFGKHMGWV